MNKIGQWITCLLALCDLLSNAVPSHTTFNKGANNLYDGLYLEGACLNHTCHLIPSLNIPRQYLHPLILILLHLIVASQGPILDLFLYGPLYLYRPVVPVYCLPVIIHLYHILVPHMMKWPWAEV